MSKLNALYTDRVAPGLVMEFEECINAPVEVVGFFTRKSNGFGQKMSKPPRGQYFDPDEESTEVFWILKVGDNSDLIVQNVASLNRMQGFTDCITVNDHTASFSDGAVVTASGNEILFSIQA